MSVATGFANALKLAEHAAKHGPQFGTVSENDYLDLAKAFLEAPLGGANSTQECLDADGDIVRFNKQTDEFGVVSPAGIIRTYFKPIPYCDAAPGLSLLLTHNFPTNQLYYEDNCA